MPALILYIILFLAAWGLGYGLLKHVCGIVDLYYSLIIAALSVALAFLARDTYH